MNIAEELISRKIKAMEEANFPNTDPTLTTLKELKLQIQSTPVDSIVLGDQVREIQKPIHTPYIKAEDVTIISDPNVKYEDPNKEVVVMVNLQAKPKDKTWEEFFGEMKNGIWPMRGVPIKVDDAPAPLPWEEEICFKVVDGKLKFKYRIPGPDGKLVCRELDGVSNRTSNLLRFIGDLDKRWNTKRYQDSLKEVKPDTSAIFISTLGKLKVIAADIREVKNLAVKACAYECGANARDVQSKVDRLVAELEGLNYPVSDRDQAKEIREQNDVNKNTFDKGSGPAETNFWRHVKEEKERYQDVKTYTIELQVAGRTDRVFIEFDGTADQVDKFVDKIVSEGFKKTGFVSGDKYAFNLIPPSQITNVRVAVRSYGWLK